MKKMEEKIDSYEALLSERDTQIAYLKEKVKRAKDVKKAANKLRHQLKKTERYLNKDRPTWCHLLYYFTIYHSTCFEC